MVEDLTYYSFFINFYLVTAVDKPYNNYATSFYIGIMKSLYSSGSQLLLSTNTTDNIAYFVRYSSSIVSGTLTSRGWYTLPENLKVVSSSFSDRFKGVHVETNLPIALKFVDWGYDYHTFLALPCHDYQISQYEYYIVSSGSYRNTTMSQALLVGCQNNTTVTITPSVDLSLPNNTQEPDIDIVVSKGISHTVLLHEGQTLYFGAPDVDITGTHIVSDKPLTVITGHECGSRPDMTYDCSPVQLQVPPTVTWGTKFILPSLENKYSRFGYGEEYPAYVKIITTNKDTTITSGCNETVHYDTQRSVYSFYYNTGNSFNCYVETNKPVLVTVFFRGYGMSMSLIPPMEQYSENIDFEIYIYYFVANVIVTTTPVGFSSSAILYNGQPITNWTTVYDSSMNIMGYVAEIREDHYSVNPFNRSIVHTHKDGRVSVLVYEADSWFITSYIAGINLMPINRS